MKNLFFDFDGTIANTKEGIINALVDMSKTLGIPVLDESIYLKFIGPALTEGMKEYYPDFPEARYPEAIAAYDKFYNETGINQLSLYPHMKETLAQLKSAGYNLYISSAKPDPVVKILIPRLGLSDYFSGIYGAATDGFSLNTKSAILNYGLTDAKITDLDETVMIGDRITDIIGGAKNNVHTLGITYGFGDHQELADAGAEVIVDHVTDIPEGIKKFN